MRKNLPQSVSKRLSDWQKGVEERKFKLLQSKWLKIRNGDLKTNSKNCEQKINNLNVYLENMSEELVKFKTMRAKELMI